MTNPINSPLNDRLNEEITDIRSINKILLNEKKKNA